jgi:HD superfamily phosphohydrolase
MEFMDYLYGRWTPPPFLQKLMHTREIVRLRKISQSVMPNFLNPHGPIPNRFQHGMGAAFLAFRVLDNNPWLTIYPDNYNILLPVASLYHDAGNPALSHLAEPFLKETTGQDGESFLATVLYGSESEKIFRKLGTSVQGVVDLVTGRNKPMAEVLHGSMDIDNLDNVLRYSRAAHLGREFDAVKIASSLTFKHGIRFENKHEFENRWCLLGQCYDETRKWQEARAAVYECIYGAPHMRAAMMIHRALQLAFCEGEINTAFFLLDDRRAVDFLLKECNPQTRRLVDMAERWRWYETVKNIKLNNPGERIEKMASGWRGRAEFADLIARNFNLPQWMVCAYIGKGKDKRRITIPFLKPNNGTPFFDESDDRPYYRVGIYVFPGIRGGVKSEIGKFAEAELF